MFGKTARSLHNHDNFSHLYVYRPKIGSVGICGNLVALGFKVEST